MDPPDTDGFLGVTLAQTVAMAAEVDEVLDELSKSGATIVKPGPEVFWDGIRASISDQADTSGRWREILASSLSRYPQSPARVLENRSSEQDLKKVRD